MNFIIRLLITAVVAFFLAKVLDGVEIVNPETAIIFAIVLAVLNALVKPVIILFTLPVTLLTFGLFLFIINAIIILLADYFIKGIEVNGLLSAIIFSLLLSVITSILNSLLTKKSD